MTKIISQTPNPINIDGLEDFDAAEYLDTPEGVAEFLKAALEGGDMKHFAKCVGIAARAEGMTAMAEKTGMQRDSLYRLTSGKSNPRLDTISKVVEALGFKLTLTADVQ
jgi:probable addiction module antidote protein